MSVTTAVDGTNLRRLGEFTLSVVKAFGELPEAMPQKDKPWAWARASHTWNRNLELLQSFVRRDAGKEGFSLDNLGFGDIALFFDWPAGGEPKFHLSVNYRNGVRPPVPEDFAHQVFMKWWGLCDQEGGDMALFSTHCDYEEN